MKRTQRKTVKTTRATKNGRAGYATKVQMSKALGKVQRDTIDAMIAEFGTRMNAIEQANVKTAQTLQHILGSDFMVNHAEFRRQNLDLEEGMPGISMPE